VILLNDIVEIFDRHRQVNEFWMKWHLDEVVITIRGKRHWLWRAVDQNGCRGYDLDAATGMKKQSFAFGLLDDASACLVTEKGLISYGAPDAYRRVLELLLRWTEMGMPPGSAFPLRVTLDKQLVSSEQYQDRRGDSSFIWRLRLADTIFLPVNRETALRAVRTAAPFQGLLVTDRLAWLACLSSLSNSGATEPAAAAPVAAAARVAAGSAHIARIVVP
jgi:hypothetical protein